MRESTGKDDEDAAAAGRLDKWLWFARFFKTRPLAAQAIEGGRVHLNGERVRQSHRVRTGDLVSISLDGIVAEFAVLSLPQRRGPATEAQRHYAETPASAARRAHWREQQRLAHLSRPRPESRPDKRERRQLMRLQRG